MTDLNKLTIEQLRDIARRKKCPGYSTLRRQELILFVRNCIKKRGKSPSPKRVSPKRSPSRSSSSSSLIKKLNSLTVKQLQGVAKKLGCPGYSTLRRVELINFIKKCKKLSPSMRKKRTPKRVSPTPKRVSPRKSPRGVPVLLPGFPQLSYREMPKIYQMSVDELRNIARKAGCQGHSTLRKSELIKFIEKCIQMRMQGVRTPSVRTPSVRTPSVSRSSSSGSSRLPSTRIPSSSEPSSRMPSSSEPSSRMPSSSEPSSSRMPSSSEPSSDVSMSVIDLLTQDPQRARKLLDRFNLQQLINICSNLGCPVHQNLNKEQMINHLIQFAQNISSKSGSSLSSKTPSSDSSLMSSLTSLSSSGYSASTSSDFGSETEEVETKQLQSFFDFFEKQLAIDKKQKDLASLPKSDLFNRAILSAEIQQLQQQLGDERKRIEASQLVSKKAQLKKVSFKRCEDIESPDECLAVRGPDNLRRCRLNFKTKKCEYLPKETVVQTTRGPMKRGVVGVRMGRGRGVRVSPTIKEEGEAKKRFIGVGKKVMKQLDVSKRFRKAVEELNERSERERMTEVEAESQAMREQQRLPPPPPYSPREEPPPYYPISDLPPPPPYSPELGITAKKTFAGKKLAKALKKNLGTRCQDIEYPEDCVQALDARNLRRCRVNMQTKKCEFLPHNLRERATLQVGGDAGVSRYVPPERKGLTQEQLKAFGPKEEAVRELRSVGKLSPEQLRPFEPKEEAVKELRSVGRLAPQKLSALVGKLGTPESKKEESLRPSQAKQLRKALLGISAARLSKPRKSGPSPFIVPPPTPSREEQAEYLTRMYGLPPTRPQPENVPYYQETKSDIAPPVRPKISTKPLSEEEAVRTGIIPAQVPQMQRPEMGSYVDQYGYSQSQATSLEQMRAIEGDLKSLAVAVQGNVQTAEQVALESQAVKALQDIERLKVKEQKRLAIREKLIKSARKSKGQKMAKQLKAAALAERKAEEELQQIKEKARRVRSNLMSFAGKKLVKALKKNLGTRCQDIESPEDCVQALDSRNLRRCRVNMQTKKCEFLPHNLRERATLQVGGDAGVGRYVAPETRRLSQEQLQAFGPKEEAVRELRNVGKLASKQLQPYESKEEAVKELQSVGKLAPEKISALGKLGGKGKIDLSGIQAKLTGGLKKVPTYLQKRPVEEERCSDIKNLNKCVSVLDENMLRRCRVNMKTKDCEFLPLNLRERATLQVGGDAGVSRYVPPERKGLTQEQLKPFGPKEEAVRELRNVGKLSPEQLRPFEPKEEAVKELRSVGKLAPQKLSALVSKLGTPESKKEESLRASQAKQLRKALLGISAARLSKPRKSGPSPFIVPPTPSREEEAVRAGIIPEQKPQIKRPIGSYLDQYGYVGRTKPLSEEEAVRTGIIPAQVPQMQRPEMGSYVDQYGYSQSQATSLEQMRRAIDGDLKSLAVQGNVQTAEQVALESQAVKTLQEIERVKAKEQKRLAIREGLIKLGRKSKGQKMAKQLKAAALAERKADEEVQQIKSKALSVHANLMSLLQQGPQKSGPSALETKQTEVESEDESGFESAQEEDSEVESEDESGFVSAQEESEEPTQVEIVIEDKGGIREQGGTAKLRQKGEEISRRYKKSLGGIGELKQKGEEISRRYKEVEVAKREALGGIGKLKKKGEEISLRQQKVAEEQAKAERKASESEFPMYNRPPIGKNLLEGIQAGTKLKPVGERKPKKPKEQSIEDALRSALKRYHGLSSSDPDETDETDDDSDWDSPKRKLSSKRKSPKRKSPKRKSPKRKSPKRKTPKRKSSKRKSPKRKTPKRKTPKRKTPKRKTPTPRPRRPISQGSEEQKRVYANYLKNKKRSPARRR